jgi:ligand-binding sensor domain-containing protein
VEASNVVYRVAVDEPAVVVAGGGPLGDGVDHVETEAMLATFGRVTDLAVSPGGKLYIATDENVYRVDADGKIAEVYSGDKVVYGIAVDAEERLYVAAAEEDVVYSVSAGGEPTEVSLDTPLANKEDVAVDDAGNLYIGSQDGIHRVDPDGTTLRVADNPQIDNMRGSLTELAFDRHGNLYYFDGTVQQVKVLVQPGQLTGPFNWAAAIWIAVLVLAAAAAGWFGLRWWRRRSPAGESAAMP